MPIQPIPFTMIVKLNSGKSCVNRKRDELAKHSGNRKRDELAKHSGNRKRYELAKHSGNRKRDELAKHGGSTVLEGFQQLSHFANFLKTLTNLLLILYAKIIQ